MGGKRGGSGEKEILSGKMKNCWGGMYHGERGGGCSHLQTLSSGAHRRRVPTGPLLRILIGMVWRQLPASSPAPSLRISTIHIPRNPLTTAEPTQRQPVVTIAHRKPSSSCM